MRLFLSFLCLFVDEESFALLEELMDQTNPKSDIRCCSQAALDISRRAVEPFPQAKQAKLPAARATTSKASLQKPRSSQAPC